MRTHRFIRFRIKLQRFADQHENTRYQLNLFRLLASAIPCLRSARILFPLSKYWMFCSQLIAQLYIDIGVLPNSVKPEDVIPQDFIYDADHQIIARDYFILPPTKIVGDPVLLKHTLASMI